MKKSMFPEFTLFNLDPVIRKQVKKNKSVIIGARAINKQIGLLSRGTVDYDILSKKPKRSARQLERTLDRNTGQDLFYSTPSIFHKGTHKVIYKGPDQRRGTRDDMGVADFTKMKKIRTVTINGVKHAALSETIKDKRRALASKKFAFRHVKDQEDLNRIKAARQLAGGAR